MAGNGGGEKRLGPLLEVFCQEFIQGREEFQAIVAAAEVMVTAFKLDMLIRDLRTL